MGEILTAATREPVTITSYGKPTHMIVDIEQWRKMLQQIEDASPAAENNRQSGDTTT